MRSHAQIFSILAILSSGLFLVGCGGDKGKTSAESPNKLLPEPAPGYLEPGPVEDLPAAQPVAQPIEAEPVKEEPLPTAAISTEVLKALLPETIRGFEFYRERYRTNTTYTTLNTYAERTYFGPNSSILVYRIKDAHKPNLVNIEAEEIKKQPGLNDDSESQLLRVTEVDGFPCFEKHVKTRNDSLIEVLIEDRVLVQVTGVKIALEDLRPLLRFYDLNLIQEHVKEEVRQQEYRAYQEREALKAAGQYP